MATIKFILSKSQHQRKTKSNESMLMLRYTHNKKTVLFTTHKNIMDKFWDVKKQNIKKGYHGYEKFNIYLSTIKQKVEDIVNGLLINDKDPTTTRVKNLYKDLKHLKKDKTQYTFFEYAELYINHSKKHKKPSTIMGYRTVINRLKKYEVYRGRTLNWDTFHMDFYYDFFEYYTEELGYLNNGFGKIIKILKVILNDAYEKGSNPNDAFLKKKFKSIKEEVNNIYLTEEEIQKMLDLDLSQNQKLQQIRDLFVVGCYTGLRFSDLSRIKKEYINGDFLTIKTIKTNETIEVPLFDVVKDIMKKYSHHDNNLPKSFENQTMNKYLKTIGRLAKIDDSFVRRRNKGKSRVEETYKKYQLISTHTARRSFATNMVKRGINSHIIMKITGHRTEKSFSSYIKITQRENAEVMLRLFNEAS
ncbi:tyrosine-type recombinase/integrase [Mesonia hippocampi]|uniref:site-specific integrase n=1 Tax=Mesonia hippocampi TaxID=1628250 RepID=UPI003F9D4F65